MDYTSALILIAVTIFVAASVRIAKENERFAVFVLGRFLSIEGPGLLIYPPLGTKKLVRVALGAECEVQSSELLKIGDYALPYVSRTKAMAGTKVKVVGFTKSAVEIEPLREHYVICEKCGHKNAI